MIYKVTFYIVDSLFQSFSTNWMKYCGKDVIVLSLWPLKKKAINHYRKGQDKTSHK